MNQIMMACRFLKPCTGSSRFRHELDKVTGA